MKLCESVKEEIMWENTKQRNLFKRKLRGKTNKYLDYIPSFPLLWGGKLTFVELK